MILWLKGVVFNVTTVDLKRWVLLPDSFLLRFAFIILTRFVYCFFLLTFKTHLFKNMFFWLFFPLPVDSFLLVNWAFPLAFLPHCNTLIQPHLWHAHCFPTAYLVFPWPLPSLEENKHTDCDEAISGFLTSFTSCLHLSGQCSFLNCRDEKMAILCNFDLRFFFFPPSWKEMCFHMWISVPEAPNPKPTNVSVCMIHLKTFPLVNQGMCLVIFQRSDAFLSSVVFLLCVWSWDWRLWMLHSKAWFICLGTDLLLGVSLCATWRRQEKKKKQQKKTKHSIDVLTSQVKESMHCLTNSLDVSCRVPCSYWKQKFVYIYI